MNKPNRDALTIVVPVYNEQDILSLTASHLLSLLEDEWKVIFVNDGSTDQSPTILNRIALESGAKVVHHKLNKGYGAAIKSGIQIAKTPYVITVDADGQHNYQDIHRMLELAIQTDTDMIVGNRQYGVNQDVYRSIGRWLIRCFARLMMPLKVTDLNSGFKLYKTHLAKRYLALCPDTMAFSDVITIIFTHQKHLILELPIQVNTRKGGKSKINTWTAIETILEILNAIVMLNPMKVFLPLAILSIGTGILWGTYLILRFGRGVSVGSLLAIVTGLIFFTLGLLAQQISKIRLELASLNAELAELSNEDS